MAGTVNKAPGDSKQVAEKDVKHAKGEENIFNMAGGSDLKTTNPNATPEPSILPPSPDSVQHADSPIPLPASTEPEEKPSPRRHRRRSNEKIDR